MARFQVSRFLPFFNLLEQESGEEPSRREHDHHISSLHFFNQIINNILPSAECVCVCVFVFVCLRLRGGNLGCHVLALPKKSHWIQ